MAPAAVNAQLAAYSQDFEFLDAFGPRRAGQ